MADLAGRWAVEKRASFSIYHKDFESLLAQSQAIQFHSDGGKNEAGTSAAFTITFWETRTKPPTRILGGIFAEFIEFTCTPFYSEALALYLALQKLQKSCQ